MAKEWIRSVTNVNDLMGLVKELERGIGTDWDKRIIITPFGQYEFETQEDWERVVKKVLIDVSRHPKSGELKKTKLGEQDVLVLGGAEFNLRQSLDLYKEMLKVQLKESGKEIPDEVLDDPVVITFSDYYEDDPVGSVRKLKETLSVLEDDSIEGTLAYPAMTELGATFSSAYWIRDPKARARLRAQYKRVLTSLPIHLVEIYLDFKKARWELAIVKRDKRGRSIGNVETQTGLSSTDVDNILRGEIRDWYKNYAFLKYVALIPRMEFLKSNLKGEVQYIPVNEVFKEALKYKMNYKGSLFKDLFEGIYQNILPKAADLKDMKRDMIEATERMYKREGIVRPPHTKGMWAFMLNKDQFLSAVRLEGPRSKIKLISVPPTLLIGEAPKREISYDKPRPIPKRSIRRSLIEDKMTKISRVRAPRKTIENIVSELLNIRSDERDEILSKHPRFTAKLRDSDRKKLKLK